MGVMSERKKSELTREHILMTGRQLILRRGFGGVGLKELLDQSAVPKGSFYYYFASKEAFGCALLEDYCADYLGRLDTLFVQAGSGRERLMRYWRAWLEDGRSEGLADRCLVVKLAAEISDLSEDMRIILQSGVERLVGRIAEVIADGQADGSITTPRNPQPAARALYSLWLGAAVLSKLGKHDAPMRDALLATERLLSDPTAD
ncbi:HTH-type transcriptional repressor NemR [compost metagenome]